HVTVRVDLATPVLRAYGQRRVIRQHRADAGDDGARLRTQTLHILTSITAGNPFRFTTGHGGATIEAHRQLDAHKRATAFHALDKTGIERTRLVFQQAGLHGDAGRTELVKTFTGNAVMRILHRRNDSHYA